MKRLLLTSALLLGAHPASAGWTLDGVRSSVRCGGKGKACARGEP